MTKLKLTLLLLTSLHLYGAQEAQQSTPEQKDLLLTNILKGDINAVHMHLQKYPTDIDHKNISRETTLMLAVKSNSFPIFMEILNRTKKENLKAQSTNGQYVYNYLFRDKVDENNAILFAKSLFVSGLEDYNFLLCATLNGFYDIVKMLLENEFYKININTKCNAGFTALLYAVQCKQKSNAKKIITTLLQHGANINICGNDYLPPLFRAIELCDIDLVCFLIDNGAKLDYMVPHNAYSDYRQYYALHFAIMLRTSRDAKYDKLYEIIKLLIIKGYKDKETRICSTYSLFTISGFALAIKVGDYEVAKFLLSKGADFSETVGNQSLTKYAQSLYEKENNADKKEEYRKIYELLQNPYKRFCDENEADLVRLGLIDAVQYMQIKRRVPTDVTNIIETYVTGSVIPKDIESNNKLKTFNQAVALIYANNIQEFSKLVNEKPGVLFLKYDNGIVLTHAVKANNVTALTSVLHKFRDLYYKKILKTEEQNKKQKIKHDDSVAEGIDKLNEKLSTMKNDIMWQLQAALQIVEQIGDEQLKNIIIQYKQEMFHKLFAEPESDNEPIGFRTRKRK